MLFRSTQTSADLVHRRLQPWLPPRGRSLQGRRHHLYRLVAVHSSPPCQRPQDLPQGSLRLQCVFFRVVCTRRTGAGLRWLQRAGTASRSAVTARAASPTLAPAAPRPAMPFATAPSTASRVPASTVRPPSPSCKQLLTSILFVSLRHWPRLPSLRRGRFDQVR